MSTRHGRTQGMVRGKASYRGFTLLELVVVMALLALLAAIGIGAFRSAIQGSEETLAETQLNAGLASARAAAIRSLDGDTAAVFTYQINGRLTILTCVQVGEIEDTRDPAGPVGAINVETRPVFVVNGEMKPAQLPLGWMVRGHAFAGTIDGGGTLANGWYEATAQRVFDPNVANWVFPETEFYSTKENDASASAAKYAAEGNQRQSFMVRFRAGTGEVVTGDSRLAIVIDPVKSTYTTLIGVEDWRPAVTPFSAYRIDKAKDVRQFVRRLIATRDLDASGTIDAQDQTLLRALIGNGSTDTILVRPVPMLALYNERRMVSSIGTGRLSVVTGCVYAEPSVGSQPELPPKAPNLDPRAFVGFTPAGAQSDINAWMEGRLVRSGRRIESSARIFTIDPYSGVPREVTP